MKTIPYLIAAAITCVAVVALGIMDQILAIVLPALLLAIIAAGHLHTIFEPYSAIASAEGQKTLLTHKQDPKLKAIAAWWTDKFFPPPAGAWPEDHAFYGELLEQLARRRFFNGDDASRLVCQHRRWWHIGQAEWSPFRLSAPLAMALAKTGQKPALSDAVMQITPVSVKTGTREFAWCGHPAPYISRFGDSPDNLVWVTDGKIGPKF